MSFLRSCKSRKILGINLYFIWAWAFSILFIFVFFWSLINLKTLDSLNFWSSLWIYLFRKCWRFLCATYNLFLINIRLFFFDIKSINWMNFFGWRIFYFFWRTCNRINQRYSFKFKRNSNSIFRSFIPNTSL